MESQTTKKKLDCPICFETFEAKGSHEPRLLPCGHTFCFSCLSLLFSKLPSNFDLYFNFSCPLCRDSSTVRSVQDFKLNLALRDVLENEALPETPSKPCSICDSGAENYCPTCKFLLCSDHSKVHRESKAHQLAPVPQHIDATVKMCKLHPTELPECFCKNCNVVLCYRCVVEDHLNHDCVKIGYVSEKRNSEKPKNSWRRPILILFTIPVSIFAIYRLCHGFGFLDSEKFLEARVLLKFCEENSAIVFQKGKALSILVVKFLTEKWMKSIGEI
eukprot:TRINITY_DN977_c0_g1_i2.p1 TRINITY_DN977_c0_g1~~TRINITY_DN977_c0_g1_i2.p1  ORF type:complete len:274 (+),score=-2.47 TRINITY_DN977_c0_g1_i2:43-864(+)